jgi:hypothetical protein
MVYPHQETSANTAILRKCNLLREADSLTIDMLGTSKKNHKKKTAEPVTEVSNPFADTFAALPGKVRGPVLAAPAAPQPAVKVAMKIPVGVGPKFVPVHDSIDPTRDHAERSDSEDEVDASDASTADDTSDVDGGGSGIAAPSGGRPSGGGRADDIAHVDPGGSDPAAPPLPPPALAPPAPAEAATDEAAVAEPPAKRAKRSGGDGWPRLYVDVMGKLGQSYIRLSVNAEGEQDYRGVCGHCGSTFSRTCAGKDNGQGRPFGKTVAWLYMVEGPHDASAQSSRAKLSFTQRVAGRLKRMANGSLLRDLPEARPWMEAERPFNSTLDDKASGEPFEIP